MNKQEYAEYQQNVKDFFEREEIEALTTDGEEYFSKRPCEMCGDWFHGNREDARAVHKPTRQILNYSVCTDCVYYNEYGRLDDKTMLQIEEGV